MTTQRTRPQARRIVVIGGSLTGLFCAAALAGGEHGSEREVTIVERDHYPDRPAARRGVPQGTQTHVLLASGLAATEELLPGIRADLVAAGAIAFDGGDLAMLTADGWLPTGGGGFELITATRPLFEHVVRTRVLALPGVRSRTGARVTGLRRTSPHRPGMETGLGMGMGQATAEGTTTDTDAWTLDIADGPAVEADLVVDASGRTSRLPQWLAQLGFDVPAPIELDARAGYATRIYRGGADLLGGCPGVLIGATPERPRGAMAIRAEDDRWMVTAVGFGDDRPPRDDAGFERFLDDVGDPVVARLIAAAQPEGETTVHRQTSNVRHPYERMSDGPTGLVAVGDALCAFDPVYGQGITIGALQARELRRIASRGLRVDDSRRVQRAMAGCADIAWSLSTAADRAMPASAEQPSRFERWSGEWVRMLGRIAVRGDAGVNRRVLSVYNLVASPASLFHPALVLAVIRSALSRDRPLVGRPRELDAVPGVGVQS